MFFTFYNCKLIWLAFFQNEEFYVCVYSHRYGDTLLFHHEGGVDIGDVDAKAVKMEIAVDNELSEADIESKLLVNVPEVAKK